MAVKNKISYGFVSVLLTAGFLLLPGLLQAATKQSSGILQGFEPGASVDYTVTSAKGSHSFGAGTIDGKGEFQIPSFGKPDYASLPINYAIEVNTPGETDPLAVMITLHAQDNRIAVKASGLDEFAAVKLQAPSFGTENIRSDWAGIFQKENGGRLEDIVSPEGFQVAFFGGRMNDAASLHQDPRIIRVQLGSFSCAGITPVPISLCRPGHLKLLEDNTKKHIMQSMQGLTRQFSAVAMQSTSILGKFLDAKMQLETQLQLQRLKAEAHKDYQPSELMCQFGSFTRSLPKAEERASFQKIALSENLMKNYRGHTDVAGAQGSTVDGEARYQQFRKHYCNPRDNSNNLGTLCEPATGKDPERKNRDIDYVRLVGRPLTLDVDFSSQTKNDTEQKTEEDILALARNLYWPQAFDPLRGDINNNYEGFMNARKLYAMGNVSHNSFATIVGLKSKNAANEKGPGGGAFMKALLREFGLSDEEITDMMGNSPSYYAQMEVLAKKIYQSPDFYTNLYDKPANVERIGVSIDAVKLMQARDQFEAALRREMLTSLMVEEALSMRPEGADTRTRGGAGSLFEKVNRRLK